MKSSFSFLIPLVSLTIVGAGLLTPKLASGRVKKSTHARARALVTDGLGEAGLSDSDAAKKLREKLKQIISSAKIDSSGLGVWVGRSADQGIETYFEHNANQTFIPASLSKLPTLATVLHELRPGFKFKTLLLADAEISDRRLLGPIYLRGGGDPSFVSEDMWLLVNDLSHTGINEIEGDIIVDDSRFDRVRFGPDRQKERVDRAFDAPIGAMSMNWNSVNVYVRPGQKVGDKLKVSVDISSPYLHLRNETKTAASGHGQNVSVERQTDQKTGVEEVIVRGSMGLGVSETVIYKSITAPDLFSGYNLAEFLKQRGIVVKGSVRNGVAPASAKILATFEGKPLAQIVADMAKWSNNFVAEMLVKNLSAEAGDAPGTMESGIGHVRTYLETIGLKKGQYEFVNAAGFTRENKLSPSQLGRLLETAHNDFTAFPEFLSALPIAGVDGTLHKRMIGTPAERWVRAKTGLLNGVAGLAGFAGRANGSILSFAFIYNGAHDDLARGIFDKLAAALVED